MTWTTDKPAVPGWYWYRRNDVWLEYGGGAVIDICRVRQVDLDNWQYLPGFNMTEWAGPIDLPKEPS